MTAHVVHIPRYLPPTTNALYRGKLRVRMRLEAECRDLVAGYVLRAGLPRATGRRRVELRLTFGPGRRRPDPDNLDGCRKAVLDALVRCGALAGDSARWCDPAPVAAVRGPESTTTIVLEEIGDGPAGTTGNVGTRSGSDRRRRPKASRAMASRPREKGPLAGPGAIDGGGVV